LILFDVEIENYVLKNGIFINIKYKIYNKLNKM